MNKMVLSETTRLRDATEFSVKKHRDRLGGAASQEDAVSHNEDTPHAYSSSIMGSSPSVASESSSPSTSTSLAGAFLPLTGAFWP